ncbi:hypothetical protein M446_6720 [Methylobacterium sp. 4-46]|uniref:hypothetical protein n=1 Tax=unclassified Methylobacterium TaxID=2615210 RepID=UPI000165CCD2|nr:MULTISPECIES: hypothetical protein [Methylobacterium]ACA20970.1 hypothetical protein M446_6720 [Methylobacterium sp. 4-46]WFT80125.1 hypothetical protein QA634_33940 [Methylobacterium nodulans]
MQALHDHDLSDQGLAGARAPIESLTAKQRAAWASAGEALLAGCLSHLSAEEREAFWIAVRLCYNRPYNAPDAAPRAPVLVPPPEAGAPRAVPGIPLPAA